MTSRSPAVLATIGVGATLALTVMVLTVLLLTGGSVTSNAALLGALIALGGVFTTQLVNTGLEAQRAYETALQNYFEQVGKLLIEHSLRDATMGDTPSTVARAHTLAALEGSDPVRKRILLQFLYESKLIHKDQPVVSLVAANLSWASLRHADLREADLRGAVLQDANLSEASLKHADLRWTNLCHANLVHAKLVQANLAKASLSTRPISGTVYFPPGGANLMFANLTKANLEGANLQEANLGRAYLQGANLKKAHLTFSKAEWAYLTKANLEEAYLIEANLRGADLREANLKGADLVRAKLSHTTSHSRILRLVMQMKWANLARADLRKANLTDADLRGASLKEAKLEGAILTGANLNSITSERSNRSHKLWRMFAERREVYIQHALISARTSIELVDKMKLRVDPQLDQFELDRSNQSISISIHEDDLRGTNLSGACLKEANLNGADLRGARNLTQVQINSATGDEHTKLPDHLHRPAHWTKGDEKLEES